MRDEIILAIILALASVLTGCTAIDYRGADGTRVRYFSSKDNALDGLRINRATGELVLEKARADSSPVVRESAALLGTAAGAALAAP